MGTFLAAGAVGGARRPLAEVQQPKGGGKAGGGGKAALPLSMYGELPEGEIAIEEFERFALDRLRVLKGIDDLKVKGFRPDQMQEKVTELWERHMGAASREERARKDVVSHFVLRLAYCRTEDLRRWLIAQECDLFRARFRELIPSDQRAFMEESQLPFRPLGQADYEDAKDDLAAVALAAGDIPLLVRESFPLCMVSMYGALHEQHHLKHEGRMQFGLFLKGLGLPLEEAIRFWRTEMAPVAPGEKFDKQYLYNVRHNYGKEGQRKDYTPYTCMKIIGSTPGVGQVHGCPYKTFGQDSLRAALSRLQVAPAKVEEAVLKAAAGHFQLACASAWEGKHSCACDSGINHPNQYFEESRKALEGEQGSDGGAPGAAAAGAGAPPKTPAGAAPAATRQLQDVLGSNGAQPSGGAAKVQRTG
ncbi:DNA primase large subunit [Micractinium conductrix]|uniref:DNA primase large subunit n=1 Tax=Micractinium conductrix TaxID=554055 RepID=A0A2P6VJP2_9CHLO|nr:DNA primase large subunit [Micractinium conductrix]|eukprot:PSC74309.1 DNA primase large subunit [Micractinium conductrix]